MDYIYSIENDTNGKIVNDLLEKELKTIGISVIRITTIGDSLILSIDGELNSEQQNLCTSCLFNHQAIKDSDILTDVRDYYTSRAILKAQYEGISFSSLSPRDKEIVATYCLTSDETIIGYYMEQGLTQEVAVAKHLVRRAEDINKASITCKQRAESPIVKYIAIKYMTEADAAMFMDAIRNLITDYSMLAHLGNEYGQSRDGIMDFIEATNGYVGAGLSNYTFRTGVTYENCRDEFKNFLVNGTKPTEFDVFSS